jgi:hypothetical protein
MAILLAASILLWPHPTQRAVANAAAANVRILAEAQARLAQAKSRKG